MSVSFVFKPKKTGRVPSHIAGQLQQMVVSEYLSTFGQCVTHTQIYLPYGGAYDLSTSHALNAISASKTVAHNFFPRAIFMELIATGDWWRRAMRVLLEWPVWYAGGEWAELET